MLSVKPEVVDSPALLDLKPGREIEGFLICYLCLR